MRPRAAAEPLGLTAFGSCTALLSRLRRDAAARVGPYGLEGSGPRAIPGFAAAPSSPNAPAAAAPGHSTTNVQEAAVGEADLVQTDGRLLLAVRQDPLGVQVVDVSGPVPQVRGLLRLPWVAHDAQLLLVNGRAVVVSSAGGSGSAGPRTAVRTLSVADPDAPRVEREVVADGALAAVRVVSGRLVLVLGATPGPAWEYPRDGTERAMAAATAENRRRLLAMPLERWLPAVRSTTARTTWRPSCSAVLKTSADSGTSLTTVVSIDPATDAAPAQVTVAGSAATVYASSGAVYVTTAPTSGGAAARTEIHAFDLDDAASPRYAGSGSVAGRLIGSYAMSEHEGHLRVASTTGDTRSRGPDRAQSELTVLRLVAGRLAPVGRLAGLGPGERVYGVRYLGDRAYVVTFREVDPLHVLDLSDPTRPRLLGELHVTGYSSHLQPVRPGLLLGVGQEIDGGTRGSHVSTFDVSDAAAPALRARQVFPGGWSVAEVDPHALLLWPASGLVVLPLNQYSADGEAFQGAVALRVDDDGDLQELRRITHPAPARRSCCASGVVRAVVVRDALLTVSGAGVLASGLDDLEERAWSPYP